MEGRSKLWLAALERAREERARKRWRRREGTPSEWREFTEEQVEVLMRLAEDDEMTTANFKELVDRASGLMGGGGQEVGFMIQCLLVTLREGRTQKFYVLWPDREEG